MFLSFHLRSVFTPRFTISDFNFHLPHGSVIAGFWIVSKYLWECCPCGLHSVISRLLAVGSLGFRTVPLLLPGSDYCMAFLWCCLCALVLLCHTNPWGDTMLSSLLVRFICLWTDQLITGRAGFWCVVWVFVCVLCGFWFLLFALLFCTVTAQWIMYRSNSVLFCMHIVVMTDVATALIRWICKMQLSFRLDKRPGESHLALDGKKSVCWVWFEGKHDVSRFASHFEQEGNQPLLAEGHARFRRVLGRLS